MTLNNYKKHITYHIMKRTLLYLLLAVLIIPGEAARPLRRVFSARQSDGTTLRVIDLSNHRFSFHTTADGIPLVRNAKGDFCYAHLVTNNLEASEKIAHDAASRTIAEQTFVETSTLSGKQAFAFLSESYPETTYTHSSRSVGNGDGLGTYGQPAGGVVSSIGTPLIPVIMVEFPDRKFAEGTTPDKLSRALNENKYADEQYSVGSVKDYFTAQSSGLFVPSFQVVATVTAEKGYAYYGQNSGSRKDINSRALIQEALDKAAGQGVDFGQFKVQNGTVPLVSIFYAGPGEHSAYETGCENYLWAHFSKTAFTVNGTRINSYFIGNELLQTYDRNYLDENNNPIPQKAAFDGIGVFVHEFGHALRLPDFYYTGTNPVIADTLQTLNYWSIMDYGQYYRDGYAPIGYNAMERSMMGWTEVHELTEAQAAALYPFGSEDKGHTAFCIKNDANKNEYFLLENRQPDTWFPASMGHGMLVTHVDYDATAWKNNNLNNNPDRQRFQIVPADNVKAANGWTDYKGDLFPGTTGISELTDETTPSTSVYTGSALGKPIYGITEKDGIIRFAYMDASLTGIDGNLAASPLEETTEVFTIDGRFVKLLKKNDGTGALKSGVYLLKNGSKYQKVFIK